MFSGFICKSWVRNIISSLMVRGCDNVAFNFTSLTIVDIAHSGFLYQGPLHNWHSFHNNSKLSTSQKNKRNFCIRIILRNFFNQRRNIWVKIIYWHSFHYKSKLSTSQKNKRNFCIRIILRNFFNQRHNIWVKIICTLLDLSKFCFFILNILIKFHSLDVV